MNSEKRVLEAGRPGGDLDQELNRLEAAQGDELVGVIASLHPIVGGVLHKLLQVLFVLGLQLEAPVQVHIAQENSSDLVARDRFFINVLRVLLEELFP